MSSSPLLKKRKFDSDKRPCVICSGKCDEKQKWPQEKHWKDFEERAKEWKRVRAPKYSHVYESIIWEKGPDGVFWHKDCKWQLMNKRTLEQATRAFSSTYSSSSVNVETESTLATEMNESTITTRNSTGPIHSKNACIWCRTPYDDKHANRGTFHT